MVINCLLNMLGIEPKKNRLKISDEYDIEKTYSFNTQKDINTFWNIGEGYGPLQAGNMNNYFQVPGMCDNNNTICISNKSLVLYTNYEPKEFYKQDIPEWRTGFEDYPEKWTIPFKSGKIVSKDTFYQGILQIEAKLPNVKYMWPAIWLTGSKTWPPEIDIAEAYNDGKIQYASSNNIILKPNIHYLDKNGKHKATNPLQYYVKNPDEQFITYSLWWEDEFIRIYYDGNLAYELTDKEILKQFNQPMHLILNNAVEWGTKPTVKDIEELDDNKLEIKRITYLKKC